MLSFNRGLIYPDIGVGFVGLTWGNRDRFTFLADIEYLEADMLCRSTDRF